MDISVVIPVCSCRACLESSIGNCRSLARITKDYEIVLVNDACPQNSWEVIKSIASRDPHVKGLDLCFFGQFAPSRQGCTMRPVTGSW
jgi:dolichol-phosphate mannosyltransferase